MINFDFDKRKKDQFDFYYLLRKNKKDFVIRENGKGKTW